MASSKSTVRIYIRDMDVIRAIYWLEIGPDDSAYFGTSVTDFKRTGLQSIDVTTDGARIEMDHGKLEAVDVGGKHSLHKSGVLLGHRIQGKKRVERHTIEIAQYRTCIPLVGVLLMNPLIYPRTEKSLRSRDIVPSTVKFANHPFAFILYLQPDGAEDTKVLDIYREQGMCVEAHSRIGTFTIRAALYTNPDSFRSWPPSQVEVIGRDLGDKPQLKFPIFTGA